MNLNKRKLKDLFKFLPKAKHKAGEGLEKGTYPFYTSSAVVNKYLDEYDYDAGKLIFATGGSASVHYANSKFAVSTDNFILEPNEDVNAKYVYYYLKNNIQILQDGFHGAGLQHLSKDYLNEINIPILDSDSQERIVSILDKADEIRQKKRVANDKLDEFLKSTFIEMFGTVINNKNNLPIMTIGECIDFNPSKPVLNDNCIVTFLGMKDISECGKVCLEDEKEYKDVKTGFTNFINDDVLLAKITPCFENGKSAIVRNLKNGYGFGSTEFHVLRTKKDLLLPECLYQTIHSNSFIKAGTMKMSGAVGQKRVPKAFVQSYKIVVPPIEDQNKFAQIVEKVEAQKQKNELVIEQMNNLFNSLSQQAFNGELAQSDSVDLITKQTVLHAKIIDKCNSHQTFGAVKMEKIFNLCDMSQELNLVPGGYYRKAAGPYVPEMRHSVEEKLAQNNWVKTINKGNGKKVEFKKDTKFAEYKNLYSEIFKDYEEQINKIIDYFYDKDTDYCEAFSTLYMCWNDLILEGKNPSKFEIIDEFKNHWAPEKQRFERIYLLEILSEMSNNHFEPHGQGLHTVDSEYNVNKDQLNLQ